MMSPSPNDAYSEDGSQVMWGDGERSSRRGWRADDSGNRRAVLIVLPAADHPSRSSLDRLRYEYERKDELDETWATRPLDLVRDAGRTILVLGDGAASRVVCGNARSARGVDDTAGSGSDEPERTARSCDLENTAPGWRRRICGHDNLLFLVQGAAGEVSGSRGRYVFPIYANRWLAECNPLIDRRHGSRGKAGGVREGRCFCC